MVTATISQGVLHLALSPLHKLLALKSSLDIPLTAIRSVQRDVEAARRGPEGTRNPGTSIPYLVHAGSFNSGVSRSFWDVHNPDNAISIHLTSGMFLNADSYDRIVVEVSKPLETIEQIQSALNDNQSE